MLEATDEAERPLRIVVIELLDKLVACAGPAVTATPRWNSSSLVATYTTASSPASSPWRHGSEAESPEAHAVDEPLPLRHVEDRVPLPCVVSCSVSVVGREPPGAPLLVRLHGREARFLSEVIRPPVAPILCSLEDAPTLDRGWLIADKLCCD